MTRPPTTMPHGRVAGVDYGRRRIGLAVCDAERILSSPLCVRETNGDRSADARFFSAIASRESLVGFVVGLPVHTDGHASAMSQEVERFGGWLSRVTGLPVVFHDERYSSHAADGLLSGIGLSRGRRKHRSDAVAAHVILSAWLDSVRAGGVERPPESIDA